MDDLTITESGHRKVVFAENFDEVKLGGSIKGRQAGTKLPVYAKCSIPGWNGRALIIRTWSTLSAGELPRCKPLEAAPGSPHASADFQR